MDTTVFLAQIMGPVFVAAGISAALNAKELVKAVDEFLNGFAIRYFGAMIEMGLGLAIILTHNVWGNLAAFLISLMGWGMLVEGTVWLVIPGPFVKMVKQMRTTGLVVLSGIIGLVIGLYWVYFGYVMV